MLSDISFKDKAIIFFRLFYQLCFIIYISLVAEDVEVVAIFGIAIIAAEGYRLLGQFAAIQTPRYRDIIGLVTGVLNGIIFMVTIYVNGYVGTEVWLLSIISVITTAITFGAFGSIAEGVVLAAIYFVIGTIEGLPTSIVTFHDMVLLMIAVMVGISSQEALIAIFRFRELEKTRALTKEQRSRFIGVISHSLRTPLSTIRGYIDLLVNERAGKLKKEQKDLVEKLQGEAQELHDLIQDFLKVSVIENPRFKIVEEDFDICELVKEIHDELLPVAKEKDVKLVSSLKLGRCEFTGDRIKLENAIKNLIDNAIKFTAPKGTIEYSAYMIGDNINIEVKDTGIGIPEEEIPNLFTMFGRATNVFEYDYEGIGLGLYMTKVIVEAHGGRIEVESEIGVGSTFKIILPTGRLATVIRKIKER